MVLKFEDVSAAARRIDGQVERTPLVRAHALSHLTGADIRLKLETLQVTNAFKVRGALNRLLSLTAQERAAGVIALSAGNHAQAVAWHATRLGIRSVIVMPALTPWTKVERTKGYGADVVLHGATLAEARERMEALRDEHGLTLVHPYDDELVMAGQGTIAIEMLEQAPDLDTLVIPIGGGGLMSGMGVAARHLRPDIELVGVELDRYPAMLGALKGEAVECGGSTLAEGIAVKEVGVLTLETCRALAPDIRLVGETDIEKAVVTCLRHQKLLAEGAGAAGLAAVLADPSRFAGKRVGLVVCGGNIDMRMVASLIHRDLERDSRIVRLSIQIDDTPGILGKIATILGDQAANILEVHHQRAYLDIPAKGAELEVVIETRNQGHAALIVEELAAQPYVSRVRLVRPER